MRIGLIQMRCEKGAIQANLEQIAFYLEQAEQRGVEIIGLPEMSLTGYADPNLFPHAVLALDGMEIAQLLEVTRKCSAVALVGLIEKNPLGKPFITHVVVQRGILQGYYRKRTIQDDETEWFSAGERVSVFQSHGVTFGIAICADIQNESVFQECARQGAKIVFELAAPGLYGEQSTRDWRAGYEWWEGECTKYLSEYARQYGIWIAVATQAGRTVDEDFPGGGYLFAPTGERVYATSDWLPGPVFLEIDFETGRVVKL